MANAVSTVQRAAQILGAILLIVGIIGFFNNPVLGLFSVNAFHNLFHIATGAIFLWAGFNGHDSSIGTFKTFGVIYALLTIFGFVAPDAFRSLLVDGGEGGVAGADPASRDLTGDNILHLVLTLVFLGLGFGMKGRGVRTHTNV